MTTRYLIFLTFFLTAVSSFGQSYLKKLIKSKSRFDLMTMQKKYDQQANLFYKPFVDLIGGKDSLIHKLKSQDSSYKASNYLITSEKFDTPTVDKISGDTIRAVIKHLTEFYDKGQKFHFQKYYVAVSTDKGRKWFFVDTNFFRAYNIEIKQLFPDLTSIREIFLVPTEKLINPKDK